MQWCMYAQQECDCAHVYERMKPVTRVAKHGPKAVAKLTLMSYRVYTCRLHDHAPTGRSEEKAGTEEVESEECNREEDGKCVYKPGAKG
jgi:hypothetical protein